jgi:hypothetical protein
MPTRQITNDSFGSAVCPPCRGLACPTPENEETSWQTVRRASTETAFIHYLVAQQAFASAYIHHDLVLLKVLLMKTNSGNASQESHDKV